MQRDCMKITTKESGWVKGEVQLSTCIARSDCFYGRPRDVTATAAYRF